MTNFDKDPGDTLDYSVSWTLAVSEDIATSSWAVSGPDSALTIGTGGYAPSVAGDVATVWLSGGTVDRSYEVTNTITTTNVPQRIYQTTFRIVCVER